MTQRNDPFLFTRFLSFPRIIVPYSCLIGKTALAGPRVDFFSVCCSFTNVNHLAMQYLFGSCVDSVFSHKGTSKAGRLTSKAIIPSPPAHMHYYSTANREPRHMRGFRLVHESLTK